MWLFPTESQGVAAIPGAFREGPRSCRGGAAYRWPARTDLVAVHPGHVAIGAEVIGTIQVSGAIRNATVGKVIARALHGVQVSSTTRSPPIARLEKQNCARRAGIGRDRYQIEVDVIGEPQESGIVGIGQLIFRSDSGAIVRGTSENLNVIDVRSDLAGPTPAQVRGWRWHEPTGKPIVPVLVVLQQGEADLVEIGLAGRAPRGFPDPVEDRKKNGG